MADIKRTNTRGLPPVSDLDFENFFSVREDSGGKYYDMTDSVYFEVESISQTDLFSHQVALGENLHTISRLYFDTHRLWWLIGMVNGFNDPFVLPTLVGTDILIPSSGVINSVIDYINE